ncbi:MAG: magnesium transporter [Alphaproteobacteria bacterium]|nr:magnesium transporter [Alphaproteobacteria bacterium]
MTTPIEVELNAPAPPDETVLPTASLDDDTILEISQAININDFDLIASFLTESSASDTADLIAKLRTEDRESLLNDFFEIIDPNSFTYLNPELRKLVLMQIGAQRVAYTITRLESDDALDLVIDLEDEFQQEVIRKLSASMRVTIEEGLNFPEDSAGRLMQREVVAVPQFWTVGKTIDYLREASSDLPADFFDVFVITPAYHIVGQVPVNQLIRAKRNEKLEELSLKDVKTIPASMDQEEVAMLFRHDSLVSAAVVDEAGRLIGTITIDDIIDVIDEEAQEDILKMAGVEQGDLYRAILSSTGTRFRWLFVNLLTAILASIVISFFDATIEQIVALAVLMPIVASMGGNAGTQTLTVAVRALAMRELSAANTWRIIWKESIIGSINGVLFAAIAGVITALWFGNMMLGTVIGLSMIVNLLVAGFFGACIPIIIDKMGSDPAVSSTVFLTTLTDIVGFFVFLGLASLMLL